MSIYFLVHSSIDWKKGWMDAFKKTKLTLGTNGWMQREGKNKNYLLSFSTLLLLPAHLSFVPPPTSACNFFFPSKKIKREKVRCNADIV